MVDYDPDKDARKEAEAKQEMLNQLNREINDWNNVMKTDSGKRVIVDLMQFCGHQQSIFDKHNSEMCRRSGKADVGFYIQNKLAAHTPQALLDIMQNAAKLFANDN